MAKYNLIIFHTPQRQGLSDFTTIGDLIARKAPDISVTIISPEIKGLPRDLWQRLAKLPSVVFSPQPLNLM
jgi:hypothetical protein